MEQRNFKVIDWFSKGFWVASKDKDTVRISDLRFGEFRMHENDPPDEWQFVFSWSITGNPERLIRQSPSIRNSRATLLIIWRRLIGDIDPSASSGIGVRQWRPDTLKDSDLRLKPKETDGV
jgi:hypothetical protein